MMPTAHEFGKVKPPFETFMIERPLQNKSKFGLPHK
jgi:hypothetical protein